MYSTCTVFGGFTNSAYHSQEYPIADPLDHRTRAWTLCALCCATCILKRQLKSKEVEWRIKASDRGRYGTEKEELERSAMA